MPAGSGKDLTCHNWRQVIISPKDGREVWQLVADSLFKNANPIIR